MLTALRIVFDSVFARGSALRWWSKQPEGSCLFFQAIGRCHQTTSLTHMSHEVSIEIIQG